MATPPRNFEEWMRAVERKIAAARGSSSAAKVELQKAVDKLNTDIANGSVDGRTPAAPTEITAGSSVQIDGNGKPFGQISITFTPVTKATDATDITVDRYELWGRDETGWNGTGTPPPWRLVDTSRSPAFGTSPFKIGSTWRFRIAAIGATTLYAGLWSSEIVLTMAADTTPPPQPSAPALTQWLGVVQVAWDGLTSAAGVMPPDFARIEIAMGTTSSPTTLIQRTFTRAGSEPVGNLTYGTTYYFRFRAVDTSGNVSGWSVQSSISPTQLVPNDIATLVPTLSDVSAQAADARQDALDAAAAASTSASSATASQTAANAAAATATTAQANAAASAASAAAAQDLANKALTSALKTYHRSGNDAGGLIAVSTDALTQTNLQQNPWPVSATGWNWQLGTSEASASSVDTTNPGPDGKPGFLRRTITTAKTGGNSGSYRNEVISGGAGDTYTSTIWVRSSAAVTVSLNVTARNVSTTVTTQAGASTALVPNVWTKLTTTLSGIAGTYTNVQSWVLMGSTQIIGVGGTFDVARAKVSTSSADTNFFYGDSADTATKIYGWNGTANASTSYERTATTVTLTPTASDGSPGGYALRKTGVGATVYDPVGLQDFDPEVLYQLTYKVRCVTDSTSGNARTFYAGLVGFKADGLTPVSTAGAIEWSNAHYFAASGTLVDDADGWKTFVGYVKGFPGIAAGGAHSDPLAPGTMNAAVRKVMPVCILDNVNGNGTWELGSIDVEIVSKEGYAALLNAQAAQDAAELAAQQANDAQADAEAAAADAAAAQAAAAAAQTAANNSAVAAGSSSAAALASQVAAEAAQVSADTANATMNATIARGNSLYRDPSFETTPGIWAGSSDAISSAMQRVNTIAHNGSYSVRMTTNGAAANLFTYPTFVNPAEGAVLYAEMWVYADPATWQAGKQIYLWSRRNSAINGTGTAQNTVSIIDTPPLGSWHKVSGYFPMDANRSIQIMPLIPQASNTPSGQIIYVDDIKVIDVTETYAQYQAALTAANNANTAAGAAASTAQSALDSATHNSKNLFSTNVPSGSAPYGTLWFQHDATGKVIGQWQQTGGDASNNGSTWTSRPLTNSVIDNLDAGKITSGYIDAVRIKAGSMSVAKLLIASPDNLIEEPFFDQQGISWGLPATNYSIDPTGGRQGGPALKIAMAASQRGKYNLPLVKRSRAGASYRITAWVKADIAIAANSITGYITGYKADGSVGTIYRAAEVPATPANTWVQISGTYTLKENQSPATLNEDLGAAFGIFGQTSFGTGNIWVDEVTATRMSGGDLIVDGSIFAKHMNVNEIFADVAVVGKLNTQIGTFLTNQDGTGYTSTVTGQGLRVTYTDPADGTVNNVIALGTFGDDYLNFRNDTGETVASIDKDGNVTGSNVYAEDSFTYRGKELTEFLDPFPQGVDTSGFVTTTGGPVSGIAGAWMRVMSVTFVAKPGRNYKAVFQGMHVYSTVAGDRVNVKMNYVQNGGVPTSATPPTDSSITPIHTANAAQTTPPLQAMGTFNSDSVEQDITVMIWIRRSFGTGSLSYDAYWNDANFWKSLRLWIEDMGPDVPEIGTYYLEAGTSSPGTPALPTKITRTVEYAHTSVRSFTGSDATYSYNTAKGYQGLSPAGYGNLKSLWTFPSLTTLLSGATVNAVWVYFYFEHWYNNAGGTARIVYHGNSGQPTTYSSLGLAVTSGSWPRAAGRWVLIPSSLYAGIKAGTIKGFGLEGDSSYNTYGIANAAKIRIKYTK